MKRYGKFNLGDLVQNRSGIKGVVVGFTVDANLKDRCVVNFKSELNPGRKGAWHCSSQLPTSLRLVG